MLMVLQPVHVGVAFVSVARMGCCPPLHAHGPVQSFVNHRSTRLLISALCVDSPTCMSPIGPLIRFTCTSSINTNHTGFIVAASFYITSVAIVGSIPSLHLTVGLLPTFTLYPVGLRACSGFLPFPVGLRARSGFFSFSRSASPPIPPFLSIGRPPCH